MHPSTFISYSWDNDTHTTWVRELAARLRADGVDVTLDQWMLTPGDQLPAFMEQSVRQNQHVVIICTPRYKSRSDARQGGVGYEGDIMTAEVMSYRDHRKFVPVLRNGSWEAASPSWLKGKLFIDLSSEPYSEQNYEKLARTLLGLREDPPPIGKPLATVKQAAAPLQRVSATEPDVAFEDIVITHVVVEGITQPRNDGSRGSGLYSVPCALSRNPPTEWAQLFVNNWNHPPQFSSMHRPGIARISGSVVILDGTTIEEVERYHRDTLKLALTETNRQYRVWLETEQQARARKQAESAEHNKNVEDISKRIRFD